MRFIIKFQLSVEYGNKVAQDPNTMIKLDELINKLNVEASYFLLQDGKRTGIFITNIESADMIPPVAESILQAFGAEVKLYPFMSLEELKKGYSNMASGYSNTQSNIHLSIFCNSF